MRRWWSFVLVLCSVSSAFALEWVKAREGMTTLKAAAASPSTYVLAGSYAEIWSSTDGASWTRRATPAGVTAGVNGAVHGGGQFLLVGESRCCGGSDSSALALTSPDGAAWTVVSTAPAGNNKTLTAVSFGSSLYVAVGNQGTILTSPDAATWTARSSGTTQNLKGVAFGGGAFVAVGDNRTVLRSVDGVSWSSQTVPATTGLAYEDVTHTGTQFVAVGNQGAILTSPDGATWTDRSLVSPFAFAALASVASGGGVIVAGDALQVFSSADGVTWTKRSLSWSGGEPNPRISTLAYGSAGFVASGGDPSVGEGGTLHSSADGLVWTRRTLTESRNLAAAAYGNGTFCAVGSSGAVASSPDGERPRRRKRTRPPGSQRSSSEQN